MSLVDLVMPKLGESIMEATILKWHKKVGDTIQLDETLLDIATDKVDSEVPSIVAGTITEILYEVNAVVPIGKVIARIQTSDKNGDTSSTTSSVSITSKHSNETVNTIPSVPVSNEEIPFIPNISSSKSTKTSDVDPKFYSPLVMNIAQSEGISMHELQNIQGTGNSGRVSKKDILAYVADKKSGKIQIEAVATNLTTSTSESQKFEKALFDVNIKTQSNTSNTVDVFNQTQPFQVNGLSNKLSDPNEVLISGATDIVEMDRMRKVIAKHMVESVQTSPHVTSFVEADVTNMVVWREKAKQLFEKREGTKLTFTPMFLECIASVLEKFPIINSSLQGDHIIYKKDINIGMATALSTGNLIVPVIKGANQLSIVGLSKAVNHLANAARNNQLKPSDTQGGTFTVTNVGTFGSLMGTPIINQPQVAVLALGAIKKRPVVVETPAGDAILVRHMMFMSLSYDHRIVDGAVGSSFLSAVAKAFESWDTNRQWFQYV